MKIPTAVAVLHLQWISKTTLKLSNCSFNGRKGLDLDYMQCPMTIPEFFLSTQVTFGVVSPVARSDDP